MGVVPRHRVRGAGRGGASRSTRIGRGLRRRRRWVGVRAATPRVSGQVGAGSGRASGGGHGRRAGAGWARGERAVANGTGRTWRGRGRRVAIAAPWRHRRRRRRAAGVAHELDYVLECALQDGRALLEALWRAHAGRLLTHQRVFELCVQARQQLVQGRSLAPIGPSLQVRHDRLEVGLQLLVALLEEEVMVHYFVASVRRAGPRTREALPGARLREGPTS